LTAFVGRTVETGGSAGGFKYICQQMRETDVLIGGEESGGIGFQGHIPSGRHFGKPDVAGDVDDDRQTPDPNRA